MIPTCQANEKKLTENYIGKADHKLNIKPTFGAVPHNFQVLPAEQRVWVTHLIPQLLRLAPERWMP